MTVADLIAAECDAVKAMLLEKNKAYGNSALDPVRIFSKASPEEQILVRLDDKLSRLARGASAGEDVLLDILGYLILLRVQRRVAMPGPVGPVASSAPVATTNELREDGHVVTLTAVDTSAANDMCACGHERKHHLPQFTTGKGYPWGPCEHPIPDGTRCTCLVFAWPRRPK